MRNYQEKLFDSSRAIADMLTDDIGNHPERFSEMLELCLRDEYPLSMRAARVLAMSAERYPLLTLPHISELIQKLSELKTEGVRRGILKLIIDADPELQEDDLGLLTDRCFHWLADPKQAMAIRYYCIEILMRVTRIYPELGVELSELLKELEKSDSVGLQGAGRKALKDLQQNNPYVK